MNILCIFIKCFFGTAVMLKKPFFEAVSWCHFVTLNIKEICVLGLFIFSIAKLVEFLLHILVLRYICANT
jgi:hypothetical protein